MEQRSQSNGLESFLQHWSLFLIVLVALATMEGLRFFEELSGAPWVCLLVASFAMLVVGAGLIGYAKFPAYRSRQWFTLGARSVPAPLVGFYRWGWRLFLLGAALGFCLLLSRHGRGSEAMYRMSGTQICWRLGWPWVPLIGDLDRWARPSAEATNVSHDGE